MVKISSIANYRNDVSNLIVTPAYRRWLMEEGWKELRPDIAEWVGQRLTIPPRVRSGSFSASAGGTCYRKQELGYLGAETEMFMIDPELQNLFNDGSWRHLRWQAALLSTDIMIRAEVPLLWKKRRLIGSADGLLIVPDNHPDKKLAGREAGFELKGMNSFLWQKHKKAKRKGVADVENIKPEHRAQIARYALISGWDLFVVVYENKNNQEWIEFVIEITEELLDEARAELDELNDAIDRKELHEMLPSCQKLKGDDFKECGYGVTPDGSCVLAGIWPEKELMKKWQS